MFAITLLFGEYISCGKFTGTAAIIRKQNMSERGLNLKFYERYHISLVLASPATLDISSSLVASLKPSLIEWKTMVATAFFKCYDKHKFEREKFSFPIFKIILQ